MRITALKKLLHRTKQRISPALTRQRAETSELRAVSNMNENDFGIEMEQPAIDNAADSMEDEQADILTETTPEASNKETESAKQAEATRPGSAGVLDSDIVELRRDFAELSSIDRVTDLPNPTRYAALRDLGLTPAEAYLATCRPRSGGKSHLTSSVPRVASAPLGSMTKADLAEARSIFPKMDDTEIQRLYKKVTNN